MEGIQGLCVRLSVSWKNIEEVMNKTITSSRVGKYFKIEERKSSFTTEFRAATATFLGMGYMITVVSTVLASTGGTCSHSSEPLEYKTCVSVVQSDLIVAFSLVAMLGCFAMGLLANLPFGVAPGTGQAMYMAYNMVGLHASGPMTYSEALGVWMVEALFFLVISGSGVRAKMGRLIPTSVRLACAVGIGLFLTVIGLQSDHGVGLIGPDMKIQHLNSSTLWLGLSGFLIMCYGLAHEFKGSMIYGILFVTLISWFRGTSVTYFPKTDEGEARYKYFEKVVDFHKINKTAGKISFKGFAKGGTWMSLFILLYIDILGTTGTLYTLVEIGGFIDDQGSFENEYVAYMIDASVSVVGAALGISPVATYAESSTGIKEGGRTGLTAVIIGLYFSLSLVFAPLLSSVPPWAVGPCLVIVGVIMMKVAKDIEWGNIKEAVPAFITMILMPFTSSIPNGIVGGLGIYVVLNFYDWVSLMVKLVMKKATKKNTRRIETNGADNSRAIP